MGYHQHSGVAAGRSQDDIPRGATGQEAPVLDQSGPRRKAARERVIRAAQMIFGNSVVDCIVLDVSGEGARVSTGAPVPVPPELILRFRSGAAYRARRRWTKGLQIGLAYDGPVVLGAEAALVALSAFEALPRTGLDDALRILRGAAFFGDHELGRTAEAAAAAYAGFRDALRARVDTNQ
jgi:hypothetical protein